MVLRRRGEVRPSSDDVPVALLDADAAEWDTVGATRLWLEERGLSTSSRLADGPATRHQAAVAAWAHAEGHVNESGQPNLMHLRFTLGIPGHGGDVAEERMLAAGVRIERTG